MLHGVVLCGGLSRRMGSPKAQLTWGDGNLLQHAVHRLAAAGLEPLCAGPSDWAGAAGCPALTDEPAGAGPLGGIAAALAHGDCLVLAVDMPLLTAAELRQIAAAGARQGVATLPFVDGRLQPLAAFWPAQLLPGLRSYLSEGHRSVLGFLEGRPQRRLAEDELERIGVVPGHLQGFNTREEYTALGLWADGGERP